MPIPLNPNGSLRLFTPGEFDEFGMKWRGVRDGSTPTLSFGINANQAEVTVFVNWSSWKDFVLYAVGMSVVWSDAGNSRISRLIPMSFPGRAGLICTKVTKIVGHTYTGQDDADGLPEYEWAEIGLLFEQPSYRLQTDEQAYSAGAAGEMGRYLEIGPAETSVDVQTFPGGSLKFYRDPTGNTPTATPNNIQVPWNNVKVTIPEETFTVTWWRVPETACDENSELFARLQGTGEQDDVPLIGSINSSEIFGRPVGTVLLLGAKKIQDKSPIGDGTFEYRMEYTFKCRPSGWNWLYFAGSKDPNENGFYYVGNNGFKTADLVGDKESLYAARDLTTAFQP